MDPFLYRILPLVLFRPQRRYGLCCLEAYTLRGSVFEESETGDPHSFWGVLAGSPAAKGVGSVQEWEQKIGVPSPPSVTVEFVCVWEGTVWKQSVIL